jgi:hypothetical protein
MSPENIVDIPSLFFDNKEAVFRNNNIQSPDVIDTYEKFLCRIADVDNHEFRRWFKETEIAARQCVKIGVPRVLIEKAIIGVYNSSSEKTQHLRRSLNEWGFDDLTPDDIAALADVAKTDPSGLIIFGGLIN